MSEFNCLKGCVVKGACPKNKIIKPAEGHTLAPFVNVTFDLTDKKGRPFTLTVGNNSSPGTDPIHSAAITSFEYGSSNGFVFKIEIIDQQEGAFTKFLDQLHKCARNLSTSVSIHCEWGWIGSDCDGNDIRIPSGKDQFPPHPRFGNKVRGVKGVPNQLEVSFQGGLVKVNIQATGTDTFLFHQREKRTLPKMSIRNSLIELFKPESGCEPQVNIAFLSRNATPVAPRDITKFFAKTGDKENKSGKNKGNFGKDEWSFAKTYEHPRKTENKNKIQIAKAWIEDYLTKREVGITMQSDPTHGNTVIFWEDFTKEKVNKPPCDISNHLGTFIVNGGPCSSVLEFTPKINWPDAWAALSVGGGTSGIDSGKGKEAGIKQQGSKRKNEREGGCCNPENAGVLQSAVVSEQAQATLDDPKLANVQKAQEAHQKAEFWRNRPIEAELRVQGQAGVTWADPKQLIAKFVAIVFINPFHLKGTGTGCADWLAEPACNKILTNRNWQIKSVDHTIKEGSWVTTLNLLLATQGSELDPKTTTKLGGDENSKYEPKKLCEGASEDDKCA